jgi:hypothetical protein
VVLSVSFEGSMVVISDKKQGGDKKGGRREDKGVRGWLGDNDEMPNDEMPDHAPAYLSPSPPDMV